jgi:SAM-dependent methyltransferase
MTTPTPGGPAPAPASASSSPSYGALGHYLDQAGRDYFAWQGADGLLQARFNLHLWRPHLRPEHSVLDFGCGGGFLLSVLDARVKVGVEVNPHARAAAERLGIVTYPTVAEVPGQFDRVISSHALEHIPHPREALLQLRGKLRDRDSRLLLLLPIDDWRARHNRRYRPGDINQHLHTWTPLLLGNLLASCELDVLEVRVVHHAWPPGSRFLWRVSPFLFHAVAVPWSAISRQRQLFAVAALR